MFIIEQYRPGDCVCIFGYSRGAFVARKVASLLYHLGRSVTCESDLVQQWKIRENGVPWAVRVTPDPVPVKYLGVWDTVGRIYTPPRLSEVKDMFGIPDEELPLGVEHALHAVAFHENRRLFRVTLFDRKKNQNNNTDLQEVWFPGAHADVGGGDRETDLSNISLNWMISKVDMFSHLKKNAVNHSTSQRLVPRDAFHETSLPKRVVDHEETRIQSQTLRWNSEIHQTVELLQERLPKETRLATLDDLRKTGWNRLGYIVPCSNHLKPDQEVPRSRLRLAILPDSAPSLSQPERRCTDPTYMRPSRPHRTRSWAMTLVVDQFTDADGWEIIKF
ncbi:hypothetical protein FRC12_017466 [Ceratobasidium sp. 428]|nr:hypothetical protein FRC12_017466 [Ceratobasidium sp. 428]